MKRGTVVWLLLILGLTLGVFFFYRLPADDRSSQPAEAQPAVKGPQRSYRIDANLDPQNRILTGVCRLKLVNDQSQDLSELYFHLYPNAFSSIDKTPAPPQAYTLGFSPGGMEVAAVKVNNQPASVEVNNTALRVSLRAPFEPGDQLEVEIPFKVTIPQTAYRFGQSGSVTVLGNWYPVLAVHDRDGWRLDPYTSLGDPYFSQIADYQVSLVLPTEQVVASTGRLEKEEIVKDGLKRISLKAERVRDFALVASADFHIETMRDGEVTLRAFSLKGHESNSRTALHAASQSLKFFGRAFATPYPYSQFSIVEVPMEGLSGMEYPLMALIDSREFVKTDLRQWQPLISHEAAHQWWYGLVGSDQCREPWIDEGMAVWSSEMFLRDLYGTPPNRGLTPPPGSILRPLSEFTDKSEYYTLVYHGGSIFWEALENRIGREGLLQVWQAVIKKHQYREVTTSDLLALIEGRAGVEAANACREFLGIKTEKPAVVSQTGESTVNNIVSEELPNLAVESAEITQRGERNYLIIQVINRGNEDASGFSVTLEEPAGGGWTQRLAGLKAGKTYTFNCLTSGRGVVVVDSKDEVRESNENDNRFSYSQ